MRADGITVGEAMDRDAAFLRSRGIDAKDGQPTYDEVREKFQDRVRNCVLDALDAEFAEEYGQRKGWTDRELSGLFPALDAHSAALFTRLYLNL